MWQPIKLMQTVEETEWMYEVEAMQHEDGESTFPKEFYDLFMHAKAGAPNIKAEIKNFRSKYAASLTPQDIAGLHHLTANLSLVSVVEI